MSATNLQLNWTGVTHGATAIGFVTSVMFSRGGELIEYAGDNARYPQVIANNMNRPRASVTAGDVVSLMNILPGTLGDLVAVQHDALEQVGGGINWTLAGAILENVEDTGAFSQFASATATYRAGAADGITNPLTFTRS